MGKGRVFIIGLCAALLWQPRAGGTEDGVPLPAGAGALPAQFAERVDGRLGVGVWTSFDAAVAWLRNRAAAGDADARYELAHLQFTGLVVPNTPGETLALLTAAAEAGQDQAQLLLGRLHEFGFQDVRPDPVQALAWYSRAAATGSTADLRAAADEASQRLRVHLTSRG
jgi:TPR repeat protein